METPMTLDVEVTVVIRHNGKKVVDDEMRRMDIPVNIPGIYDRTFLHLLIEHYGRKAYDEAMGHVVMRYIGTST